MMVGCLLGLLVCFKELKEMGKKKEEKKKKKNNKEELSKPCFEEE